MPDPRTRLAPATRTLPQLPTEIWLQILEDINDPMYLWTSLRQSTPTFESYVDKVFLSTYIPKLSASAKLPRRDPVTSALRYAQDAPETTMQYAGITVDHSSVILATTQVAKTGVSIEELNNTGVLSKQRLEEAVMWVSIGCSRGQATPMDIKKTMMWNEEVKVWVWELEWKELVGRYFDMKKAKKEETEKRKNTGSRRENVRRR